MQLPPARKHVARQSWESLPPDGYINSRSAPLVFTTSSSFSCYTTSSIDYFIYLLLRLPPLHTMTKAFIALASYHGPFYPDGTNTGVYVSEVLHPYDVFKKHNIDVDFISETGEFEWDPKSIDQILSEEEKKTFHDENSQFSKAIKKVIKASEANGADYDIAFAAGGHAAIFDFPKDKDLQKLFQEVHAKNGVISAVCHGPAIFDNLKVKGGDKFLIEGKKVTGFTNIGEEQVGADSSIKKYNVETIPTVAKKSKAQYVSPSGPWDDFTVVDGKLVTGVNPQSATSTAEKAVKALSA